MNFQINQQLRDETPSHFAALKKLIEKTVTFSYY